MSFVGIINGPNLNLLGVREPDIYGSESFESYFKKLSQKYGQDELQYFQSNVEGELINSLHDMGFAGGCMGIVLNAGAYTHTSIAIADAIASIPVPVVLVHISNVFAREPERRTDLLVSKSKGLICGLGLNGYELALRYLLDLA